MASKQTLSIMAILAVTVVLAIVAATYWPDTLVGEAINNVVDQLVILTTTEESRLSQLEPETEQMVRQLLQNLANAGMMVEVGSTLRTQAQEKAAIASGHSAVKTHSWHEIGRAVDLYPYDPNTGQPDMNGKNDALFIQMQQAAVDLGFHQIAYDSNWNRKYLSNGVWDGGHMEWHGPYATIADAVASEGGNYGIG